MAPPPTNNNIKLHPSVTIFIYPIIIREAHGYWHTHELHTKLHSLVISHISCRQQGACQKVQE